ncbi:MAG: TlpA family protein disulfide reductase [Bacteroidales bacterium]|nr:TlpA family protein disulfide reductase [Bacteroidales bacterium]
MIKLSVKITLVVLITTTTILGQKSSVRVFDFNGLEPYLHKDFDSIYVINFWATWCAPCIKEMPDFQKAAQKYKDEKVSFLFVSLDLPSEIDGRLKTFLKQYGITSEVAVLDDPNSNAWIDKVDPGWSGSIPATLIYSKHTRIFYEKAMDFSELDSIIHTKLNEL